MSQMITSANEKQLMTCYRTIHSIALNTDDSEQKKALNAACISILLALGKNTSQINGIESLTSAIFGSQGGFTFIPFL